MSGRKGQAERGVGREVTAKELAGAQINANEGKAVGRGTARGCAFRQRLSHNGECPASLSQTLAAWAVAPWGLRSPGAHLPCSPLPSPGPGVSSAFHPGEGGRRWHRLEEGNKSPHSSL